MNRACPNCLRSLNSEDRKSSLREFVACTFCKKIYHKTCWGNSNTCTNCQGKKEEDTSQKLLPNLGPFRKNKAISIQSSKSTSPWKKNLIVVFSTLFLIAAIASSGIYFSRKSEGSTPPHPNTKTVQTSESSTSQNSTTSTKPPPAQNLPLSTLPLPPRKPIAFTLPLPKPSPSFDCTKATYQSEKLICDSEELSTLDLKLAKAYKDALAKIEGSPRENELGKEQYDWLRQIRDKCSNTICLRRTYKSRIAELETIIHEVHTPETKLTVQTLSSWNWIPEEANFPPELVATERLIRTPSSYPQNSEYLPRLKENAWLRDYIQSHRPSDSCISTEKIREVYIRVRLFETEKGAKGYLKVLNEEKSDKNFRHNESFKTLATGEEIFSYFIGGENALDYWDKYLKACISADNLQAFVLFNQYKNVIIGIETTSLTSLSESSLRSTTQSLSNILKSQIQKIISERTAPTSSEPITLGEIDVESYLAGTTPSQLLVNIDNNNENGSEIVSCALWEEKKVFNCTLKYKTGIPIQDLGVACQHLTISTTKTNNQPDFICDGLTLKWDGQSYQWNKSVFSRLQSTQGIPIQTPYRSHQLFQLAQSNASDSANLQVVVATGIDVNIKDSYGQTPLMYAMNQPNPNLAVLKTFLETGAKVNETSLSGWSALMYGARENHNPKAMLLLLGFGANPTIEDKNGDTALALLNNNSHLRNLLYRSTLNSQPNLLGVDTNDNRFLFSASVAKKINLNTYPCREDSRQHASGTTLLCYYNDFSSFEGFQLMWELSAIWRGEFIPEEAWQDSGLSKERLYKLQGKPYHLRFDLATRLITISY